MWELKRLHRVLVFFTRCVGLELDLDRGLGLRRGDAWI